MEQDRKYILIKYHQEEFYIELNEQQIAMRQLIIDKDSLNHLSCREDCLAEGIIRERDMAGEFQYISKKQFEDKWFAAMMPYEADWKLVKKKYILGSQVEGRSLFFYPQGIVIKGNDFYALYKGDRINQINQRAEACIVGYDDDNMWLILQ